MPHVPATPVSGAHAPAAPSWLPEARRLAAEGVWFTKAARQMGVSRNTLRRHADAEGIAFPPAPRLAPSIHPNWRHVSNDPPPRVWVSQDYALDETRLRALHGEGKTTSQMARALRVPRVAITEWYFKRQMRPNVTASWHERERERERIRGRALRARQRVA